VTKRYTDNLEAYQLYLKGRYHTERRTGEDIEKAIEYFKQAIAKDPNYALAYAGLADSYGPLAYFSYLHPNETQSKSQAAARKAVELDDSLAEAHAVLAATLFFQNKDWQGAEKEFLRAIELNLNYSDPHTFYAHLLVVTGRKEQAIDEARRGLSLDPLSPLKTAFMAQVFYYTRRYDEALAQAQSAVRINPDAFNAHVCLGEIYVEKKMYTEAIAELQKALPLSGDSPYVSGFLGHAFAASGQRGEALKILNEMKESSKRRYVSAYHVAIIHAGLGEKEQALDWLEKAYEEHNESMVWMGLDPNLDGLRGEPRFINLMRRLNLPQ
jgi:serine/threonine-protein kinase